MNYYFKMVQLTRFKEENPASVEEEKDSETEFDGVANSLKKK